LARAVAGKPLAQMSDAQRTALQVQATEQQALRDEAVLLVGELTTLIESASGETRQRMQQALAEAQRNRLAEAMGAAIGDLEQSSLFRAASNEKQARDQLYDLARMLARPRDTVSQLRETAEKLEQQIEEQKQVVAETQ